MNTPLTKFGYWDSSFVLGGIKEGGREVRLSSSKVRLKEKQKITHAKSIPKLTRRLEWKGSATNICTVSRCLVKSLLTTPSYLN